MSYPAFIGGSGTADPFPRCGMCHERSYYKLSGSNGLAQWACDVHADYLQAWNPGIELTPIQGRTAPTKKDETS